MFFNGDQKADMWRYMQIFQMGIGHGIYPIGSMYAIYGDIYHQYTPNVSIYTIHGSYGILGSTLHLLSIRGSASMHGLKLCRTCRGKDSLRVTGIHAPREPGAKCRCIIHLPSGKLTKNYGQSPFFMGKFTINGDFP